jgi:hypothetical protein
VGRAAFGPDQVRLIEEQCLEFSAEVELVSGGTFDDGDVRLVAGILRASFDKSRLKGHAAEMSWLVDGSGYVSHPSSVTEHRR